MSLPLKVTSPSHGNWGKLVVVLYCTHIDHVPSSSTSRTASNNGRRVSIVFSSHVSGSRWKCAIAPANERRLVRRWRNLKARLRSVASRSSVSEWKQTTGCSSVLPHSESCSLIRIPSVVRSAGSRTASTSSRSGGSALLDGCEADDRAKSPTLMSEMCAGSLPRIPIC